MVSSVFGDARLGLLQQALDGLSQRQQLVTNNIANIDTPGYQRRDVPFEATLQASAARLGGRLDLATSQAGHLSLSGGAADLLSPGAGPAGGRSTATRNDGNNVDLDYEMSELADTTLRYEMLTQATASRFALLHDIIGHST